MSLVFGRSSLVVRCWPKKTRGLLMKRFIAIFVFVFSVLILSFAADVPAIRGGNGVTLPPPPPTDAKPVTDNVNGTSMTDPYRWLEDGQSPETARLDSIRRCKYTQDYFRRSRFVPRLPSGLTQLIRVESYCIPRRAAGQLFLHQATGGREPGFDLFAEGLARNRRAPDRRHQTERRPEHFGPHRRRFERRHICWSTACAKAAPTSRPCTSSMSASARNFRTCCRSARYLGISLTPDKQGSLLREVRARRLAGLLPPLGQPAGPTSSSSASRSTARPLVRWN